MAPSIPNQVPVSAPHTIVAADKRYKSKVTLVSFFILTFNTTVPIRNSTPYPASPMIMAKNNAKNARNQNDISYSLYPGTVPNTVNSGLISDVTLL